MIESDAVVTILEHENALNLVRLDHRLQYVVDGKRFLPGAREVIGESENAAEIVRRMAPLGGEPGIVEIEPADHRADIERGMHRLELPVGAGNARAVRQCRAGNHGSQVFRAFGIAQREQSAAQRIQKIIARGIDGFATVGDIVRRIIGDVD